jgi:excinuclease UvrABC ATPase subunit
MSKESFARGTGNCDICDGLTKKEENDTDSIKTEEYSVTSGIIIKIRGEDEKKFLDQIYNDYRVIDFEIPDPNSLLTILLSMRLETKRITDEMSKKLDSRSRREYNESLKNIAIQIRSIQTELGITREKLEKRERSAVEVVKEWMKEATLYYLKDKGKREGVGICQDCKKRIIFQGDFETLEEELLGYIDEFIEDIKQGKPMIIDLPEEQKAYEEIKEKMKQEHGNILNPDCRDLLTRFYYLLRIRKIPEAYITYHSRDINKSLE